jgi:hypothetical protein
MAPTSMASSATTVAPFQGLKSTAGLPVSRRSAASLGSVSNGGRIRCMQVWKILNETHEFSRPSNSLSINHDSLYLNLFVNTVLRQLYISIYLH